MALTLNDYSIDTSGTAQDVQRRQKMADALLQEGMNTTPAAGGKYGGWLTALNRGLAGALGGYQTAQANQADQANKQAGQNATNAYLTGMAGNSATQGSVPASLGAAQPPTSDAAASGIAPKEGMDPEGKPYTQDQLNPMDEPRGAARKNYLATMLGEEKAGSPEGLGVANVIRNRAVDGGWGNTPDAVVQSPNQFSPWNDQAGRSRMASALQNPGNVAKANDQIDQAYGVGKYASAGPNDPTEGKTYFYDPQSMSPPNSVPKWAQGKQGQQIGKTMFFDDPNDNSQTPPNSQMAQGQLPGQQQVMSAAGQSDDARKLAIARQTAVNPAVPAYVRAAAQADVTRLEKSDDLKSVGGQLYNTQTGQWIAPPTKPNDPNELKTLTPGGEIYHVGPDGKPVVDHKNDKGVNAEDVPQETIDYLADRVRMGDTKVKIGYARNPGMIAKIDSTAQQRERAGTPVSEEARNVTGNAVTLGARGAAERKLGTINTNNEFYGNNALGALDIAEKASGDVPRTNYPGVNKALNAYRTNTGDPKTVALGAALNTVVNDYAKFTGGGVGTDSLRGHAEEILNGAHSHEQLQSIVHMMRLEIKRGQQSPGMVREGFDQLYAPHGSAGAPTAQAPSAPVVPQGGTDPSAIAEAKRRGLIP
jgi:Cell Wall Hydrolase